MADLITRTAKLVPYAKRPKQVPSFVTAYSYEPMSDEPAASSGSFYVVIEALAGGRQSEEVADLVIESFGQHYYRETEQAVAALTRFEGAIKAVNHELSNYVTQGNAAWIGKLSAVIAVQWQSELHISQTGSAEAYLYRGKTSTRITGHVVDRPTSPSKTFGTIVSGTFENDDRLLLTTPALFHQLPIKRVRDVILTNSPNRSIAELTELLAGSATDRIAALIIGVSTPEQAAMHVRAEEPAVITLAAPESPMDAARSAAIPLAQATVASSRKVGVTAQSGWKRAQPHVQRAGYSAAGLVRSSLKSRGKRRAVILVLTSLVGLGALGLAYDSDQRGVDRLVTNYRQAERGYEAAIANPDKAQARNQLRDASSTLARVTSRDAKRLDGRLRTLSGSPLPLSSLKQKITAAADDINLLTTVHPVRTIGFSGVKNPRPSHMIMAGKLAYVIDSNNKSSIFVVDTATNNLSIPSTDLSKLGHVTAATLAADNTGMYLATDQPQLWFFKFADSSLTAQAVSLGQWEKISSIAAYGGNLYVVSDGTVYKHIKTLSGFSAKSAYLAGSSASLAFRSLSVDGSVYGLTDTGLRQYLAGSLKTDSTLPEPVVGPTVLRASAQGNVLVAAVPEMQRLLIWSNTAAPVFSKQYRIDQPVSIKDVAYDEVGSTAYVLSEQGILVLKIKP